MKNITKFDLKILKKIQKNLCSPALDKVMIGATKLGTAGAVWIGIGGLMMLLKKYRRCGFTLAAAVSFDVFANNILVKNLFHRARPCDVDQTVALKIRRPFGASFPSGHTLTSVTAATILTLNKKSFGLGAIPLAALISFSRMYLFVHYPSDIAAATALGIGLGSAAYALEKKALPAPKEEA